MERRKKNIGHTCGLVTEILCNFEKCLGRTTNHPIDLHCSVRFWWIAWEKWYVIDHTPQMYTEIHFFCIQIQNSLRPTNQNIIFRYAKIWCVQQKLNVNNRSICGHFGEESPLLCTQSTFLTKSHSWRREIHPQTVEMLVRRSEWMK